MHFFKLLDFRLYAAVMVNTAVLKTQNVRCPQGSV